MISTVKSEPIGAHEERQRIADSYEQPFEPDSIAPVDPLLGNAHVSGCGMMAEFEIKEEAVDDELKSIERINESSDKEPFQQQKQLKHPSAPIDGRRIGQLRRWRMTADITLDEARRRVPRVKLKAKEHTSRQPDYHQRSRNVSKRVVEKARRGSEVPCSDEKANTSGWEWWVNFKSRYDCSLGTSSPSKDTAEVVVQNFYLKLELIMKKCELENAPERVWACDEIGLIIYSNDDKIVVRAGKPNICGRCDVAKISSTAITLLGCVGAAGTTVPPLVIVNESIRTCWAGLDLPPSALVKFISDGQISEDTFLEWMKLFIARAPLARPLLLILDFQAKHIGLRVLRFAERNRIILLAIPPHTSHILQPLNLGVFKSLNMFWRCSLESTTVPVRFDSSNHLQPNVFTLLNSAYEKSFQPEIISVGFSKAGIFPFKRKVSMLQNVVAEGNTLKERAKDAFGGSPNSAADRGETRLEIKAEILVEVQDASQEQAKQEPLDDTNEAPVKDLQAENVGSRWTALPEVRVKVEAVQGNERVLGM